MRFINFNPGVIVQNRVVVPVGSNGQISLYNSFGYTNVVVDVNGWFTDSTSSSGYQYVPISPYRICDTRTGSNTACSGKTLGTSGNTSTSNPKVLKVQASGAGGGAMLLTGVPSTAKAVAVNIAAVYPSASSYMTIYPDGMATPLASDLNYVAGDVVPNLTVVQLSAGGVFDAYNNDGAVDLVGDTQGWYQ